LASKRNLSARADNDTFLTASFLQTRLGPSRSIFQSISDKPRVLYWNWPRWLCLFFWRCRMVQLWSQGTKNKNTSFQMEQLIYWWW